MDCGSTGNFELISQTIEGRSCDGRLAMTGQERGQSVNHGARPAVESGKARRKAGWMVERAKAHLAPTIIGRIKRTLLGPR